MRFARRARGNYCPDPDLYELYKSRGGDPSRPLDLDLDRDLDYFLKRASSAASALARGSSSFGAAGPLRNTKKSQ